MNKIVNVLYDRFNANKRLKCSLISSIIICMIAHGYAYFNEYFARDRFVYFGHQSRIWNVYNDKYSSGINQVSERWLLNLLPDPLHGSHLPWLGGILTMLVFGIAIYLICRVLDIDSLAGIFAAAVLTATNYSVICGHFYDAVTVSIALFMACMSAWFWYRDDFHIVIRMIGSSAFFCFSLSYYGGYTSVAPSLVILSLFYSALCFLFDKSNDPGADTTYCKHLVFRGLEYIASMVIGTAVEYLIIRVSMYVQSAQMQDYGGKTELIEGISAGDFLSNLLLAYKQGVKWSVYGEPLMQKWMGISIAISMAVILFIYVIRAGRNTATIFILLGFLVVVYPLSAGLIYVLSFNNVHHLMMFTAVIIYIGHIRMIELYEASCGHIDHGTEKRRKSDRLWTYCGNISEFVLAIVFLVFTYRSILISNMSYLRIQTESQRAQTIAMNVMEHIEHCEGFTGKENVVFYGFVINNEYLNHSIYEDSETLDILDGVPFVDKSGVSAIRHPYDLVEIIDEIYTPNMYMEYYVDNDSGFFTENEVQEIKDMPVFPADGSVRKFDDEIVVKFTDYWGWEPGDY